MDLGGGCRGCAKTWFTGVEVEQETSAPPPKKNPGSAPALHSYILQWILVYNQWLFRLHLYLFLPLLPFVCLFVFFFFTFPSIFVCWWHWSADTLFDSCQSTITWMSQIRLSTIQLDTDCICLGHLATILIANRWNRNCFSGIFLKISYIHSSHLYFLSNVPLPFPSVEPRVFWRPL